MTDELLQLLHQHHNAYRHFLCNRKVENERQYKQFRSRFNYQVRLAKRQFFGEGAKFGGKSFWTSIKSATGLGRQKRKYLPWPADPLTLQWFKSYLTGRQQLTAYAGERSDQRDISIDVPQRSLLGLLLFNLYINSQLNLLPLDCAVAYADDITVVCSKDVKAIMTLM